jgi:outer membrane protein assembly factor BamB
VTGLSFEMKSTPVLADGILYINGYGAPENQPGTNVDAPSWAEALAGQDKDRDQRLSGDEVQGHARSWFGFTDLNGDKHLNEAEWKYYEAALASRNGILAIRVGGEGDMTQKNVAWAYHKRVPQLPSPLLYEGILYMVNDGGVVTTLDPATGEMRAQGRLKGAVDNYYASPVAGDGKIFFASELGKVAVLKPGGSLEVVAVNDLSDLIYATPAIDGGRLYVRTRGALYCFGES